jgi:hypothetical protein
MALGEMALGEMALGETGLGKMALGEMVIHPLTHQVIGGGYHIIKTVPTQTLKLQRYTIIQGPQIHSAN